MGFLQGCVSNQVLGLFGQAFECLWGRKCQTFPNKFTERKLRQVDDESNFGSVTSKTGNIVGRFSEFATATE